MYTGVPTPDLADESSQCCKPRAPRQLAAGFMRLGELQLSGAQL